MSTDGKEERKYHRKSIAIFRKKNKKIEGQAYKWDKSRSYTHWVFTDWACSNQVANWDKRSDEYPCCEAIKYTREQGKKDRGWHHQGVLCFKPAVMLSAVIQWFGPDWKGWVEPTRCPVRALAYTIKDGQGEMRGDLSLLVVKLDEGRHDQYRRSARRNYTHPEGSTNVGGLLDRRHNDYYNLGRKVLERLPKPKNQFAED